MMINLQHYATNLSDFNNNYLVFNLKRSQKFCVTFHLKKIRKIILQRGFILSVNIRTYCA